MSNSLPATLALPESQAIVVADAIRAKAFVTGTELETHGAPVKPAGDKADPRAALHCYNLETALSQLSAESPGRRISTQNLGFSTSALPKTGH